MAHLLQVGAGSGGMPVLDMLCRDPRITRVTLIEPDVYKPHNVERHVFPASAVGRPKAELAGQWLRERRPDIEVRLLPCNLLEPTAQGAIEEAAAEADLGVCAADNEPAKYHWDALMRRHAKPWTLGEVLSGGIGGFVHWFVPDGPCYGCVASYLQRAVTVEKPKAPDYSQPQAAVEEARVPASKSAVTAVAGLHAELTQQLLDDVAGFNPGFTSLLLSLRAVPEIFKEPFRPHRFNIQRSSECLICRQPEREIAAEDLDVALHQALERLAHE